MKSSQSFLVLLAIATGSCSLAQASSEAAEPSPVVAPQSGEDGVSILVFTFPGGHLGQSLECGEAHLREHLLGRALGEALKRQNAGLGYTVDGFTTTDESHIFVTIGGGPEGVAAALAAFDQARRAKVPDAVAIQEWRLINSEPQPAPSGNSNSLFHALAAQLPEEQVAALVGACSARPEARLDHMAGLANVTIVSESSHAEVKAAAGRYAHHRQYGDSAPPLSPAASPGPARAYFTPVADFPDGLAASMARWEDLVAAGVIGIPKFIPFASSGFFVVLPAPADPASLGRAWSKPPSPQSIDRARSRICSKKTNYSSAIRSTARHLAADPWARIATTSDWCTRPFQAIGKVRNPVPLRPAPDPAPRTVMSAAPTFSICGFDPQQDNFRPYFETFFERLILHELRFARGMALSTKARSASGDCMGFDIVGPETAGDVEATVELVTAAMKDGNSLDRAHRAQCVSLAPDIRRRQRDSGCRAGVSDRARQMIAKLHVRRGSE